jgi:Family of unknown function (DUF6252)
MKKCTIYVFLLFIVSGFFFFYAGSCNNGLDYYVKFKANGEEVIFGLGFTDVEPNAFANIIYGSSTMFVATPDTVDKGTTPSSIIVITIGGTGPGTYTYGADSQLVISFRDSGVPYILATGSTGSVKVTSFGEVGGTIEGTFEATAYLVSAQGIKMAAPPDLIITEGSFRVKRIADGTFTPILK